MIYKNRSLPTITKIKKDLSYIPTEEYGNFKHAVIDTNQKYPLVFVIAGLAVYATIV